MSENRKNTGIEVNVADAIRETQKNIAINLEDDILALEQLTSILNCVTVADDNGAEHEDIQNAMNYMWYAQKNILEHMNDTLRC